jgi:hypothetical protein
MSSPKTRSTKVNKDDNKANSLEVLDWVKKRKTFSTQEVADHFGIRLMQAAANIAILRIKEVVESAPKPERSNDKSSRWHYCGA